MLTVQWLATLVRFVLRSVYSLSRSIGVVSQFFKTHFLTLGTLGSAWSSTACHPLTTARLARNCIDVDTAFDLSCMFAVGKLTFDSGMTEDLR